MFAFFSILQSIDYHTIGKEKLHFYSISSSTQKFNTLEAQLPLQQKGIAIT
jgi:hypothetical protein